MRDVRIDRAIPSGYHVSIKLNQLRDALAVARCGGIRAAARELGLAQPSLTKSIQQLESQLEVPLFQRTRQGLRLTSFGEAFVARTQAAFTEIQRAEDEIRQMRQSGTGKLCLAMAGISLMNLLPGALQSFRQRHAGVAVRVIERPLDQALAALRASETEFAVMPEPAIDLGAAYVVEPILHDHYAIVGRKDHPLRHARSLGALGGAAWVVTRQGGVRASEFEQVFVRCGLPVPRVEVQCESIIGVLALLSRTDLLAVLPSLWLHSAPVRHVCETLPLAEHIGSNRTCIVRRADYPLTPAAQGFVAALVREANALEGERTLEPAPRQPAKAARTPS